MLCTDAKRAEDGFVGDPTEIALVELGERHGLPKPDLEQKFPRWESCPLTPTASS